MTWTLFCRQTNKIVRYNASSHISLLFTNKQTNKIIKKIACKSRIFVFCSHCKHVNCSASSQHKFSYLHDIMIIRNIFIFEPDIWWSQVELELVREIPITTIPVLLISGFTKLEIGPSLQVLITVQDFETVTCRLYPTILPVDPTFPF